MPHRLRAHPRPRTQPSLNNHGWTQNLELKKKLADLDEGGNYLEAARGEARELRERLKQCLNDFEAHKQGSQKVQRLSFEKIRNLRVEVEASQARVAEREAKLDEIRAECARVAADAKKQAERDHAEIAALLRERDELQQRCADSEADAASLRKALAASATNLKHAEARLAKAEALAKNSAGEGASKAQAALDALKAEHATLLTSHDALMKQHERALVSIERKSAEAYDARKQLAAAKQAAATAAKVLGRKDVPEERSGERSERSYERLGRKGLKKGKKQKKGKKTMEGKAKQRVTQACEGRTLAPARPQLEAAGGGGGRAPRPHGGPEKPFSIFQERRTRGPPAQPCRPMDPRRWQALRAARPSGSALATTARGKAWGVPPAAGRRSTGQPSGACGCGRGGSSRRK